MIKRLIWFFAFPLNIRRAIIEEAHEQTHADPTLIWLGINERLARAYRALTNCAG